MKHRARRPGVHKDGPMHVKDLFGQPQEAFYRLPELAVRGGTVLTDGCRKILDFTPQKLCLDMGRFIVTFYGTELRIESLNGKRAAVAGHIHRIDFSAKWEGQDATL